MPPLRGAVVGAGLMGRWHAKALRRAGATLALVVDQDGTRARALAQRAGGAAHATSVEVMRDHRIDVVHVCTPTITHESLIRFSLVSGCHVLVEKPLADTGSGTEALLALAARQDRLLCPVHQVLFQHGVVRALAAREHLRPVHVDLVMCTAGAKGGSDEHDRVVAEILPHPLSFLVAFAGAVPVCDWHVEHTAAGHLSASFRLDRMTGTMLVSTRGRPTMNGARIIGEHGTVHLDFFHGFATFQTGVVSRTRKIAQPFTFAAGVGAHALENLVRRAIRRQSAYPGLWELVSRFYLAVQTQGPPPIPPADVILVASMRDSLLAQARERFGA